tara:strand:+ start:189 stop:803 length:615 start_codon:yes stop_codon:yes gene_type:complete
LLINFVTLQKAKRYFPQIRLAKAFTIISLSLGVMMLSACGFHLRSYGENASKIESLSLNCPSTSSWVLCHHLKQTLVLNNIQISEDAPLMLTISPMIQRSRVLSLQANASAAELGLSSEVTYSLVTSREDKINHKHTIHINNSYRHESSALLAKDRERDELQTQLSQQLAEEIVRQITVLNPDNWLEVEKSESRDTVPTQLLDQ